MATSLLCFFEWTSKIKKYVTQLLVCTHSSVCRVSFNFLSSTLTDLNISDDTNVTFLAEIKLALNYFRIKAPS